MHDIIYLRSLKGWKKIMKEKILDIFYNFIVPEAARGSVDCFMYYNICFSTSIEGKVINSTISSYINSPFLEIKNKNTFDELLVQYVNLALEYYDDSYFYDEVLSGAYRTEENNICKEKVLMTLLWGNATIDDFQDPCAFLRRQITYLERTPLCEKEKLGYSATLNGEIFTEVTKTSKISWESPYMFSANIVNDDDIYDLPVIHFGVTEDMVYIYSIHQKKKSRWSKRINRALYKANENFRPTENEKNLKDVTPSSLIALAIFLLHCKNIGYVNFKIVPYLPERWIDKRIMISKKVKKTNQKAELYKEKMEELLRIQDNLTQKFIRTLIRLQYHYGDSISITSYPFEQDSYLTFKTAFKHLGNNDLFRELFSIYEEKSSVKQCK